MMIDINDFLLIVTYLLGCALLIALTLLAICLLHTLKKVDHLLDDLSTKSTKLNGVFDLADKSADAINSVIGNVSTSISNFIMGLANKKKERKEEKEHE